MSSTTMKTNLTFSDVRDFVSKDQGSDSKLIEATGLLLGAILVIGPALAGLTPVAITAFLGLLGTKDELVKIGKALYKKITKSINDDPQQREERMSIAFCLITYTAFFDSLNKMAPELTKLMEKQKDDAAYLNPTTSSLMTSVVCSGDQVTDPQDVTIALPRPAESLDQIISRHLPIYSELTKGLLRLLQSGSQWAVLTDKRRKELTESLEQLPRLSADRFRSQYFDLAARFNEFAVWSNLREHATTHQQIESLSKTAQTFISTLRDANIKIDLGLKQLREDIQAIPQLIHDYDSQVVWKDLDRQYSSAVSQPIIKDPSSANAGKPTLKYPARTDIFIPQLFKAIRYSQGMHLEEEDTWKSSPVREDLGQFILSYLMSPYSPLTPLIILGHPGSGKSLLSQILAAQTMSNTFAPIRIELRSVNADNEIEAQIEEQIRKDIARNISFSSLMDSLNGRPAIVFFDGYDELLQATGQVFAGYLTKVQKFQERESQTLARNPIRSIVTSRLTLIDKAVIPEGSTILRLLEFNESQRKRWISVWNKANANYFTSTGIKPFSLPNTPKLAPIAEQPLLLLMLALYDSADNNLNKSTGLDQTVLYESLLRQFIERERMKDPEFEQIKDEKQRTAELDRDMERLGVAAIGMFNRHALHIRATQLNKDIEFFELSRKVQSGTGRQLSQAELLLGSFFFIHQSTAQQKGDSTDEHESDTAFEFLHNTFGEFLTGYFLIGQVLRQTNSLWKLRLDPDLIQHRIKSLTDRDGIPSVWYVSLMQAELFGRPVIVSMMTEWFRHAAARGKRATAEILTDFDDILFHEIQRVMTGKEFPSVMVGKETSFDSLPLIGYLANYTLNLLTIRMALSDGTVVFDEARFGSSDGRPRAWDRLVHLWKSWFPADALNSLSAIFTAERIDSRVELRRSDGMSLPAAGRRIETITNIALAVGDNTEIALAGVVMHDSFRRQSVSMERVKRAAVAENLGIEDEILLRELWSTARSQTDDKSKHALFMRCLKVMEKSRPADLGRCIDLIRAFGHLGDPMRYRELIMRLLHMSSFPPSRYRKAADGEAFAALLELIFEIDGRIPYPPLDMFLSESMQSSELPLVIRELPANVAFAVIRWASPRSSEFGADTAATLTQRTREMSYVSGLSPHLALSFMRGTIRPNFRPFDPVVMNLLEYYFSESRILNLPADVAIGILDIAQRPRYRNLLATFCEGLSQTLQNREPEEWRIPELRFPMRYPDLVWWEPAKIGSSVLEIVSKYGTKESKDVFYRYALHRWFRLGRGKLVGSIIRYAREVDGGALLLDYLRSERRYPSGVLRKDGKISIRALVRGWEIRKLPVQSVIDIGWLAEQIGDTETFRSMSQLASTAMGNSDGI
jgi:hypothetical protein